MENGDLLEITPISSFQSPISNPYLRALYLSYNKLCLLVKSMG